MSDMNWPTAAYLMVVTIVLGCVILAVLGAGRPRR